ncbi:MAG: phage tail protein [Erysipelotrichaceae bacterium]|nr:phage tail protein [Erysipelotrichaceae bacterium]
MLANGATLAYATAANGTFNTLSGLKELPDVGVDPEKVDNTTLEDTIKKYEMGIGDAGDMTYKFKYDNTSEDSPYRVLRPYETAGTVLYFKETLKDGTTTEFNGQISIKRTGGGVNGVIEFDMSVALQSELTITDPTVSA